MKTIPILVDKLACMGVGCHPHAECAHYQAVDGSDPQGRRIPTCCMRDGSYPLYLPVVAVKVPA